MSGAIEDAYDVVVIGGGINGAGVARDAAGRGLKVLLVERGDLGGATSSASTKLIHGGLRYLEHFELRLVREALAERAELLAQAPHIAWPLRFVLPAGPIGRPAWLIRLGLFLYDRLGAARLRPAKLLNLAEHAAGAALDDGYRTALAFSDGWVDDARLVTLTAVDARDRGGHIRTRTGFVAARRHAERWSLDFATPDGRRLATTARAVVNAAGPWVAPVLETLTGGQAHARVRLIKGSHLVARRQMPGGHALILPVADGRVVFAIPYEHDFTLIGTTESEITGEPGDAEVEPAEIEYLLQAVNRYLKHPLGADDVVWRFTGVRPLQDDGRRDPSAVSRDYVLKEDHRAAPLISIIGGKITTYRALAERVVDRLAASFPRLPGPWTRGTTLPGGDLGGMAFGQFAQKLAADYDHVDGVLVHRLARRHGSRTYDVLASGTRLGRDFGGGMMAREVQWLIEQEWARTAEDILWRRTKTGLHGADAAALRAWLGANGPSLGL